MDNKKPTLPELQMPNFATRVTRPEQTDVDVEKKERETPPPLPEQANKELINKPQENIDTEQLIDDGDEEIAEEAHEVGGSINSIKDALGTMQSIMKSYETLDQQIIENKSNLQSLQKRLIQAKDEKTQLELAYRESIQKNIETVSHQSNDDFSDAQGVLQSIKENKVTVQGRGCDTVLEHVKNIRKHIIHDANKAAESLAPLTLSCDLLKANVDYVCLLEEAAKAFDLRKSLLEKRKEVNQTLQMLSVQVA